MAIHVTPIPKLTSFATPDLTLATANAAGSAGVKTTIRSDASVLVFDATVPTTIAYGATAAAGSGTTASYRNHTHGMAAESDQSGVAKGLVKINSDGTHVAASALNITSTARSSTGIYLITWATDFGSVNYILLTSCDAGDTRVANPRNLATGTVNVNVYDSNSASTLEDSDVMVGAWGAQ